MLSGWSKIRSFTVRNNGATSLTNVQVRFNLDERNWPFTDGLSNGHDLRATDVADTPLDFWRESYDATTRRGVVWVKVPSLPAGGTVSLRLQTGNAAASDASSYDDTMQKLTADGDTLALYHFDEGTGTPIDATGSTTATLVGTPAWGGSDGGGQGRVSASPPQFAAGDHLVLNGSSNAFTIPSLLTPFPAEGTIEFRVKVNTASPTLGMRVLYKSIDGTGGSIDEIDLFLQTTGRVSFRKVVANTTISFDPNRQLGTNWHHIAVTWGPRGWELWMDGEREGYSSSTTVPAGTGSPQALAFGIHNRNATTTNYGNISIDEARVSDVQRTREEILAACERRKPMTGITVTYDRLVPSSSNPIISPTLGTEQTAVQEPTLVPPGVGGINFWRMYYTGGFSTAYVHYATCPAASDPTDPDNWTKRSTPVIGNNNGGVAGQAWRNSYLYDPATGYHYIYFIDAVSTGGNLKVCRSTDGETFEYVGQVLASDVSVGGGHTVSGIANTHVWIEPDGTWQMLFEVLIVAQTGNWRTCRASGTGPTTFTVDTTTSLLTTLQRGIGMYGGPSVEKIGDRYYCFYHCCQTGGNPTFGAVAYSYDLKAWHQLPFMPIIDFKWSQEVDQYADLHPAEYGGKTYLAHDAVRNSTSYARIGISSFDGTLSELLEGVAEDDTWAGQRERKQKNKIVGAGAVRRLARSLRKLNRR